MKQVYLDFNSDLQNIFRYDLDEEPATIHPEKEFYFISIDKAKGNKKVKSVIRKVINSLCINTFAIYLKGLSAEEQELQKDKLAKLFKLASDKKSGKKLFGFKYIVSEETEKLLDVFISNSLEEESISTENLVDDIMNRFERLNTSPPTGVMVSSEPQEIITSTSNSLEVLSDELLVYIAGYLNYKDIRGLDVNKRLHQIVADKYTQLSPLFSYFEPVDHLKIINALKRLTQNGKLDVDLVIACLKKDLTFIEKIKDPLVALKYYIIYYSTGFESNIEMEKLLFDKLCQSSFQNSPKHLENAEIAEFFKNARYAISINQPGHFQENFVSRFIASPALLVALQENNWSAVEKIRKEITLTSEIFKFFLQRVASSQTASQEEIQFCVKVINSKLKNYSSTDQTDIILLQIIFDKAVNIQPFLEQLDVPLACVSDAFLKIIANLNPGLMSIEIMGAEKNCIIANLWQVAVFLGPQHPPIPNEGTWLYSSGYQYGRSDPLLIPIMSAMYDNLTPSPKRSKRI